jgi:hypothetical protein
VYRWVVSVKIAFIGHSYHHRTSSTSFLISLLRALGPVDCYWDDAWKGGNPVDVARIIRTDYDLIFLVQVLDHARALSRSGHPNVVFVPMYDGCRQEPDRFWRSCRKLKMISFSSTLHEKLLRLGLSSTYFQYFPDPTPLGPVDNFSTLRGFFWQRTQDITWNHLRLICANGPFERVALHAVLDPGRGEFVVPNGEDMGSYKIEISDWFESKSDYWAVLQRCNVFFAPRLYEGIGMSFLEAMAMGMAVVAPNFPTMNEYITHGVNGYLYDPGRPQPIDFTAAKQIAERARETVELGHKAWINSRPAFERFLLARRSSRDSGLLAAILSLVRR